MPNLHCVIVQHCGISRLFFLFLLFCLVKRGPEVWPSLCRWSFEKSDWFKLPSDSLLNTNWAPCLNWTHNLSRACWLCLLKNCGVIHSHKALCQHWTIGSERMWCICLVSFVCWNVHIHLQSYLLIPELTKQTTKVQSRLNILIIWLCEFSYVLWYWWKKTSDSLLH